MNMTIPVKGLKINTLLPPAALPGDLVPPEPQPAGQVTIELALEGSPLIVRASLSGKSVRRALKVIAEHGPENVNVVLQGNLKPAATPGGPFLLDGAGLAATPKVAKPPLLIAEGSPPAGPAPPVG
jgi:hypothetical protein